MHPGRDGQVGTSDWAEPALSHRPGTPQEQGASGEKGFPSFQHLRMLTEVLVELGRQGGEGEVHSGCLRDRRSIPPLCLCEKDLFSPVDSGMKQSPQWTRSPKTWLKRSRQPYPSVLGQIFVCSVGLHIFPGSRISLSARQPQLRVLCKQQ